MRDITLCHPKLQKLAAQLVEECGRQGFKIKIGETFRTKEEQDALYAQGRTKPGQIVTNSPGSSYSSFHQWGTAFDFYRNDGKGAYYDNDGFFTKVGQIGASLGLEWGGNWKSIVDKPHFQLPDWGSTTKRIKILYSNPEEFMKTWAEETINPGWVKDSNGWWWQDADGTYPAQEWRLINHHWYLFDSNGYVCTGWHRWNPATNQVDPEDDSGDWYFLDSTKDGPLEGACWHTRENGAQEIWHVD
uniref:L-Ala-D-Glu peptidase like protein n=1 Tax=Dulem virus 35 TaxID=3145753 RepID=A0AAU8B1I0_9CAUD